MYINLNTLKLSSHLIHDRKKRTSNIDSITKSYGTPIKEAFFNNAFHYLTDTSLIFIVDPEQTTIITYYIATLSAAKKLYGGKLPDKVRKMINKKVRTAWHNGIKVKNAKEHAAYKRVRENRTVIDEN